MQQSNHLTFKIGDTEIAAVSFSYNQTLDSPCGKFEAGLDPDALADAYSYMGKEAVITCGKWQRHCVVDAMDFNAQKTLLISGRDKVSLLVDCSAETVEFKGKQTILDVAMKLCSPFGIAVSAVGTAGQGEIKEWSVNPGETVYEVLERAARRLGVLLISRTGEDIVFMEPGKETLTVDASSQLTSLSYRKDLSEVYGKYIAKSRGASVWGSLSVVDDLSDDRGNPNKTKILVLSSSDAEEVKKRLRTEADIRAERGCAIGITFSGNRPVSLGANVDMDVLGITHAGRIRSFSYRVSAESGSAEESTSIEIGGRLEQANA